MIKIVVLVEVKDMKKLLGMLLLVFVITMGFSGVVSAADSQSHGKSMKKHHKYTDQHFIENMVPHHQAAVNMSNIALTRAEHPEVKYLAKNIKKSQSREISEMRYWYKKWYGKDVPRSSMMNKEMKKMVNLSRLESAKPFDKEFIRQMVPHHQMAVTMARMALKNAKHPEIRTLAHSIIKSQSVEITEMRYWYKKWYGTNLPNNQGMMASMMSM